MNTSKKLISTLPIKNMTFYYITSAIMQVWENKIYDIVLINNEVHFSELWVGLHCVGPIRVSPENLNASVIKRGDLFKG